MTEPVRENPNGARHVDEPDPVAPYDHRRRYITNPITGGLSILSPPGTPPVTSEDVRRWLEEMP